MSNNEQNNPVQQENQTYVRIGDENNGFLEFDLVTFREKGAETRYISVIVHGFSIPDNQNEESKPTRTQINISTEEQFLAFKKFIQQLDWKA
jgi:hypothetical protein